MNKDMMEYKDGILANCKTLRLSQRVGSRAVEMGTDENLLFLSNLLENEVASRKVAHVEKMINNAGFPKRYELEEFDSSDVVFKDGYSIDRILRLEFYDNRDNFIMFGRSRTGKTMLAIIIGIHCVRMGIEVRFFRFNTLLRILAEKRAAGTLESFLRVLRKRVSVIILDEFGYVSPDDKSSIPIFFDFVSEVYETKTFILTTNLEFSRWDTVFQDKGLTEAFIGRMTENAHIITLGGMSYPLKNKSAEKSE